MLFDREQPKHTQAREMAIQQRVDTLETYTFLHFHCKFAASPVYTVLYNVHGSNLLHHFHCVVDRNFTLEKTFCYHRPHCPSASQPSKKANQSSEFFVAIVRKMNIWLRHCPMRTAISTLYIPGRCRKITFFTHQGNALRKTTRISHRCLSCVFRFGWCQTHSALGATNVVLCTSDRVIISSPTQLTNFVATQKTKFIYIYIHPLNRWLTDCSDSEIVRAMIRFSKACAVRLSTYYENNDKLHGGIRLIFIF